MRCTVTTGVDWWKRTTGTLFRCAELWITVQWRQISVMASQILSTRLRIQQLVHSTKKTSKLCITGPLWAESTDDRWIPQKKFPFHDVIMYNVYCCWLRYSYDLGHWMGNVSTSTIFSTGWTRSCENDNIWCSSWRKWYQYDIFVSCLCIKIK